MAKGKRSKGKNYTSKGERRNVSRKVTKLKDKSDHEINKIKAYYKGQPTGYVTIPNPNKNETNKRFIKVKWVDYYHKGLDYKKASQRYVIGLKGSE